MQLPAEKNAVCSTGRSVRTDGRTLPMVPLSSCSVVYFSFCSAIRFGFPVVLRTLGRTDSEVVTKTKISRIDGYLFFLPMVLRAR